MNPSELVVRFVRSIGRPAEAEYYLSLFRAERPESFAVIAPSEGVMREGADALVMDLKFLAQLGLRPVIVLGLVDANRARAHAETVHRALRPHAECAVVGPDEAGKAARAGAIALVPGDTAPDVDGRFAALADMAARLTARKIIFLGRRSGLQPAGQEPPSLVDLTTEYDELIGPGVLSDEQAALLAQIRRLIETTPHALTVAVTSPLDLLRELFTIRGAGTLVRRGSRIERYAGLDRERSRRLRALVDTAFERRLRPEFFERTVDALYVADDFRGAAVVVDTELGAYLSKFAVDVAAQGEGVGRDLWRALGRDYPSLFWRTRIANPISGWYGQHCDGMVRTGPWRIYWRGIAHADIPRAIDRALSMPIDFDDAPSASGR